MSESVQSAAARYLESELSAVPIYDNWDDPSQSKAYTFKWRPYQERRLSPSQAEALFNEDMRGVAVICGAISGGLLMIDFDVPGFYEDWAELCDGTGIDISSWPVERTVNGGVHVFVRCPSPGKNRKLAFDSDLPNGKKGKVAIETRGEGGLAYVAPTPGYTPISGDLASTPLASQDDVDSVLAIAQSLCRASVPDAPQVAHRPAGAGETIRPGDVYNERTTWDQILCAEGHRRGITTRSGITYWTRSGKSKGVSMTTGVGRNGQDFLFVHTTNAHPLKSLHLYDKFGAFAELNHGGDLTKAAAAVAEQFSLLTKGQAERLKKGAGTTVTIISGNPLGEAPSFPYTDLGNAERLAYIMDSRTRWSAAHGWLTWDGKRFRPDINGQTARTQFIELTKMMTAQASSIKNESEQKALLAWVQKCEAASRVNAACDLLKALPGIAVQPGDLDPDPLLFNCQNGILDLVKGELIPHSPEHLMTKVSNCSFPGGPADPSQTPNFLKLVRFAFDGQRETADWLMRFFGYTLSGLVRAEAFAFLWGQPQAGKSKFTEIVEYVMGDYCQRLPIDALMREPGEKKRPIPSEIATLDRARMALAIEAPDGHYLDENFIKSTVGESFIRTRAMYKDWFDMPIRFKLWITGNNQPNIRSFDGAIRRRLNIVPFTRTVPEDQRDHDLLDKLKGEGDFILAMAAEAFRDYMASGFEPSPAMTDALDEYQRESDRLGTFIDEECDTSAGGHLVETFTLFYKAYCRFASRNGFHPEASNVLGRKLRSKGFNIRRGTGGARLIENIHVIPNHERDTPSNE